MKNKIGNGASVIITAPNNIAEGDLVLVGNMVGVAQSSAETGQVVSVSLQGMYQFEKELNEAYAAGDRLYWNFSAKKISHHNNGYFIGHCAYDTEANENRAIVRFTGSGFDQLVNTVFVSSLLDFPEPEDNVIHLEDGKGYIITENIDLGALRLQCDGECLIAGYAAEVSSLTSTATLISSSNSITLARIKLSSTSKVLELTGSGTQVCRMRDVNFENSNVGDITAYRTTIADACAFNNTGALILGGAVASLVFESCSFVPAADATAIVVPSTANISRRLRFTNCVFEVGTGRTAINFNTSATIGVESYILDRCNFSGDGTYMTGVQSSDNKCLAIQSSNISNSANIAGYWMQGNAVATTITNTTNFVKVAGTTTSAEYRQKFTHSGTNRETCNGAITRYYRVSGSITCEAGANQVIYFRFAKNGSTTISSEARTTTNGAGRSENCAIQDIVQLATNDFVEVFVRNSTNTSSVTVVDANVIIEPLN